MFRRLHPRAQMVAGILLVLAGSMLTGCASTGGSDGRILLAGPPNGIGGTGRSDGPVDRPDQTGGPGALPLPGDVPPGPIISTIGPGDRLQPEPPDTGVPPPPEPTTPPPEVTLPPPVSAPVEPPPPPPPGR